MRIITIKLIVEAKGDALRIVQEIICDAFGKEEQKEHPMAKLILMEVVEK